jgi:hypothetical protein
MLRLPSTHGGRVQGPEAARVHLAPGKGPRGPAVGSGPHRTIYLSGIDADGKVARASARRRFKALELTGPLRPYGSAHVGPGLAMDTNCSD